jgi:hypothetical protein
VLRAISEGMSPSNIKSGIHLSRYSYEYIVNRLLSNAILEHIGEDLVLTNKCYNILNFVKENARIDAENRAVHSVW